jgi:hypothetical protein
MLASKGIMLLLFRINMSGLVTTKATNLLCKVFLKLTHSKSPSPDLNQDICPHNRDHISTHICLPRRRVRRRHRGQHRGRCDRSESKLMERDHYFEQHCHEHRPAADRNRRDCGRWCHHDLLPRERGDINSRNGRGAHFLILGPPRDGAPTAADIFGVRAAHRHGRRQPNADREQPDGYDCKRRGDVCGGNSKSGDLYRALPGRVVCTY